MHTRNTLVKQRALSYLFEQKSMKTCNTDHLKQNLAIYEITILNVFLSYQSLEPKVLVLSDKCVNSNDFNEIVCCNRSSKHRIKCLSEIHVKFRVAWLFFHLWSWKMGVKHLNVETKYEHHIVLAKRKTGDYTNCCLGSKLNCSELSPGGKWQYLLQLSLTAGLCVETDIRVGRMLALLIPGM